MSRKSPQTYNEILSDGNESKGNRLYRAESSEFIDGQISELVKATAQELARIADNDNPVSTSDVEELKRRTIVYLRACESTSTIPSFSRYARSMGLSVEALNLHLRTYPNSKSSEWLRLVHDAFADMLATAAMRNLTNSIVSIFSLKARSGWDDHTKLEIVQAKENQLAPELSPAEIAEKYKFLPDD